MYVIEVIPLKRGIQVESLSYYSSAAYKEGTLITIPLRNKDIAALVVGSKPVSAAKTALKKATFSLRKLPVQENTAVLPPKLISAVQKMSERIPANTGALLYAILPPQVRDGERTYPKCIEGNANEDTTPVILSDTSSNRYIAYRSHIRQTFAHRGSVLFVVPTSAHVEEAKKKLETGIESRVITFSSTHSKKELNASFEAFEDLRHAKLIIVTPAYAFLWRHDIISIIIECGGSSYYKQKNRPYLDTREMLKLYAKECGYSLLIADSVLQTEDEIRRREDMYSTYDEHAKRLELPGTLTIARHKKLEEGEEFTLCSDELMGSLERAFAKQGHVFLYAARKGLAPLVACYDCGYIFRCPDSGAPYSLLRTFKGDEEQRWFYCGTSGKRIRAADVCLECGSWRLREQGIGIQQVYDEFRTRFPKIDILLFDHTTATTHTKAKKIISQFYAAKRSILIGTSMALPYLTKPVDISSIISYEATRAIPTWRADETVFSLLISLREITTKDVLVQLRSEPDELLSLASRGLIDQFYDGEIALRKALGYPPYCVFVLLTWMGHKDATAKIEDHVRECLKDEEVQFYSAPHSTDSNTIRHGLLRLEAKHWPNVRINEIIRGLPPFIKKEINPNRIV